MFIRSDKMTMLYGRLVFNIQRAEDLPNTEAFGFLGDKTDPFVTAEIGPVWLIKTRRIKNTLNPVWDEKFNIPVCQEAEDVEINVRDKENIGSDVISTLHFPCEMLRRGFKVEGWFDLKHKGKNKGKIKMSIQFFSKDEPIRCQKSVPDAYFPMTTNNRLTLYQDADTPQLTQVISLHM